ncbi:MAG: hypothetical protein IT340_03265 [Chloroflexi bacterium]|nr:hypothetical protein [Chloroflexota bacterium]
MDEYVIWHSAGDARPAADLAARLTAAGLAPVLARPDTPLDPASGGVAALDAAPVAIALVSSAALAEQRYDAPLAARLEARQPTLIALQDVSVWEFGLRRPTWAQRLDPAAILPPATDPDAPAWLDWLASVEPAPHTGAQREPAPAEWTEPAGSAAPGSPPAAVAAPTTTPDWLNPALLFQPPSWSLGEAPPADAAAAPPSIEPDARDEPGDAIGWAPALDLDTGRLVEPPPSPAEPTSSPAAAIAAPAIAMATEPAPRVAERSAIAPPRGRQRASRPAVTEGRAPQPASRPRPRRSAGCTCLLWVIGIIGGLIALVVVAFIALAIIGSTLPDDPETTPVPVAEVAETVGTPPAPTQPASAASRAPASPTPRSTATRVLTALPTATPLRIVRDTFSNAALGLLPRAAADGAGYRLGYEQGEYTIAAAGPTAPPAIMTAALAGSYGNVTLSVDARLVGEPVDRVIALACRDQTMPGNAGYRLLVNPARRQVALARGDAGRETLLADWRSATVVRQNNQTNRLELRCLDATITGLINGASVVQATDSTYRTGTAWLGVAVPVRGGASETRFDNLTVTALPSGQ